MWTLAQKPAFWPVQSDKLDELGISGSLVTDLVLRYVHRHGVTTLAAIGLVWRIQRDLRARKAA